MGQTGELRELRSELYIKCLLYRILFDNCFMKQKGDFISDIKNSTCIHAEEVVNILYDQILPYIRRMKVENISTSEIWYSDVEYYYYTTTVFWSINEYFKLLSSSNGRDMVMELSDSIHERHSNCESLLDILSVGNRGEDSCGEVRKLLKSTSSTGSTEYLDSFDKNCIGDTIVRALIKYSNTILDEEVMEKDNTSSYERDIYFAFRECYADVFMLLITGLSQNVGDQAQYLADIYFHEMVSGDNAISVDFLEKFDCRQAGYEQEDNQYNEERNYKFRFYCIYRFLCRKYSKSELALDPVFDGLKSMGDDMNEYSRYYVDCVVEYLIQAAQKLEEKIEKNTYFGDLKMVFENIDCKDAQSILTKLEELHKE